ncbi:winged helix DNA-binding domain-containing protein [Actinacidiphila sp. ITFR-21]|uniref:winged helix DNA-binding domain-containing protein n=1 Tax=Actinacidiphila sp. ITFR-21 TaxID=3075199 RepID=UPI00288B3777|nr:winged helix DNA-binding domain-containing protein [Streptomyces sp. ITFR-21]WNI18542.1 winged helix DNA-binding domain-containing protein [Streptomyces sp. ITFR-21]
MPATVNRRTLNRTLLDRQLLLERADMGIEEAVSHLLGLQSQVPGSPYPGLWGRLRGFTFERLGRLLTERRVVRLGLMRNTVHLVTAADALRLRSWLRPKFERDWRSSPWAAGTTGVDMSALVALGRRALRERPLGPAELKAVLGERFPAADPESLVGALRTVAPLVQLPPRGVWGAAGGGLRYAFLDDWVGRPLAGDPGPAGTVRRYLAAYGPATPADMQKWSGLTGLGPVFAGMDLRTYTGEDGRRLYDLPDAALADPALPAPARFVADFDNLLLSHADRTRILGDVPKTRVITVNGLVRGTVLIDGFVGGTWRFERTKGVAAAVAVTPFTALRAADRDTLAEEGARLLAAADPAAAAYDVRFEPPA